MIRLLSVVVAALLGAGCGGDDDGQARTVDAPITTTTDPSEDTTTTAAGAEDTPTTTAAPAELAAVVLQLDDLPTGWSVSPPEDDEENEGDEADDFCNSVDPFNDIEPQQEAESNYQQSDFGPFAGSRASLYEDTEQGGEVVELLADVANACPTFTEVDEDGTETEYTITPLSFPDLGDDTFAFRMSTSTLIGPLALDIAAVQQGPLVVTLIHGGMGTVDSELTETLMRTMLARV